MAENAILLAERFLAGPLMMEESAIRSLTAAVDRLKAGGTLVMAAGGSKPREKPRSRFVAVIGIHGIITPHASIFTEIFGGAPLDVLGAALDEVLANDVYSEVILDIDSPGGSVFGTEEFANKIFEGRKRKKITAVASGLMASAAYYIGSQASELVASPSSLLGSVGVYQQHTDYSRALDKEGVAVTFVSSTPEKVAGNPYEPLGDVGRKQLQGIVDGYYAAFLKAVARGRNVGVGKVQADYGKGGVVLAADAVNRGMADRVASFDAVLTAAIARASGPTAGSTVPAPAAKLDTDLELRKRKLRLTMDDHLVAETLYRAANPPQPAPPKPRRPANRSVEDDIRFAYHEAGHAVTALSLRVAVDEATIQPGTCPVQGPWEGCVTESSRPGSIDRLVIVMAGPIAEGDGAYLMGPDEKMALECARPDSAVWRQAEDRARRILSANWSAVKAVARALTEQRTMTGEQLRQAAGYVHPG